MADYLNTMISKPSQFVCLIKNVPRDQKIEILNRRRYDALDGTLLHLVVMALVRPTIKIQFTDDEAFVLVKTMIENRANPLIENYERKIPYELFDIYSNRNQYKTFRYLLQQTTNYITEGTYKRDFYEDYLNGDDYYDFDRSYL